MRSRQRTEVKEYSGYKGKRELLWGTELSCVSTVVQLHDACACQNSQNCVPSVMDFTARKVHVNANKQSGSKYNFFKKN